MRGEIERRKVSCGIRKEDAEQRAIRGYLGEKREVAEERAMEG